MSFTIRIRAALFALLAIAVVFVGSPTADAQSYTRDTGKESAFLASLNAQRAAKGIAPLQLSASMSQSAGAWTANMVQGNYLAHSSNLAGGVPGGWAKLGENVGRGRTVQSLTSAFMNSAGHARNVLDPSFTHVGIAVVVHPSGRVYTTHRFAALPSAAPAPSTRVAAAQPQAPRAAAPVVAPKAPVAPTPAPPAAPDAAPNSLERQRAAEHEARMELMASIFGRSGS